MTGHRNLWRFSRSRYNTGVRMIKMGGKEGFTLIEVIVCMVLVGIVAAVAGMAIVTAVKGYVLARENVAISEKAQVVIARMGRELMEISKIDTGNSNGNCIRYRLETVSQYYRAIGLNNGNLELKVSAAADCDCPTSGDPGNVLVDQVGNFALGYEDENGSTSTAPPANLTNLYAIHIDLTLNRADGNPGNDFSIVINPRNNGNLNGPGSSS